MQKKFITTAFALLMSAGVASAQCDTVTFSDVGWTDITATTAATTVVLDALGYETDIKVLSVPVHPERLTKAFTRNTNSEVENGFAT